MGTPDKNLFPEHSWDSRGPSGLTWLLVSQPLPQPLFPPADVHAATRLCSLCSFHLQKWHPLLALPVTFLASPNPPHPHQGSAQMLLLQEAFLDLPCQSRN